MSFAAPSERSRKKARSPFASSSSNTDRVPAALEAAASTTVTGRVMKEGISTGDERATKRTKYAFGSRVAATGKENAVIGSKYSSSGAVVAAAAVARSAASSAKTTTVGKDSTASAMSAANRQRMKRRRPAAMHPSAFSGSQLKKAARFGTTSSVSSSSSNSSSSSSGTGGANSTSGIPVPQVSASVKMVGKRGISSDEKAGHRRPTRPPHRSHKDALASAKPTLGAPLHSPFEGELLEEKEVLLRSRPQESASEEETSQVPAPRFEITDPTDPEFWRSRHDVARAAMQELRLLGQSLLLR